MPKSSGESEESALGLGKHRYKIIEKHHGAGWAALRVRARTSAAPHVLRPGLPPRHHWHCSRRGGAFCRSERKILNCLVRPILTEPRAVAEDQHSRGRTSDGLVTLLMLHSPIGLQEQMAFGSNSQLGALSLPRYSWRHWHTESLPEMCGYWFSFEQKALGPFQTQKLNS